MTKATIWKTLSDGVDYATSVAASDGLRKKRAAAAPRHAVQPAALESGWLRGDLHLVEDPEHRANLNKHISFLVFC